MLIGLGSQSAVKQEAVQRALALIGITASITAVKAVSGVAEQPYGNATYHGAINRVLHTASLVPGADITLAIESGIFEIDGQFYDKAIIVARTQHGRMFISESEAIQFPREAVIEAQRRGNDWTAGKVMQELGTVSAHNDPHLSLVGTSRIDFIVEALVDVLRMM